VLFGVGIGLRPLNELEDAIKKRSSADLSPILRHVPRETKGIVARLNSLFLKVTEAQEAQQRFVSLAAHQLRNPVAAIHTMAEATQNARSLEESKKRADALVAETRDAMRLTNQLLSLERIKGGRPKFENLDLRALLQAFAQAMAPRVIETGIEFDLRLPDKKMPLKGDPLLLREAVTNLVENALSHGGAEMTYIRLSLVAQNACYNVLVENDGNAIQENSAYLLFERFAQGKESKGAGLGLAIAKEIGKVHGGNVALRSAEPVEFVLTLARES
jgi:two-component system sensor histidine kinase TctE